MGELYEKNRLKHVDDSKKNLFAMKLSSENVYDYNLRKSPLPHNKYSNRDNSPMPPLFSLTLNSSKSSQQSFMDHINNRDNDVIDSNSSISNQKENLKHITNKNKKPKNGKTRKEIDLNAVKAKLKKVKSSKDNND